MDMKRILVAGGAVVAGGAAFLLVLANSQAPEPVVVVQHAPEPAAPGFDVTDILVATRPFEVGDRLTPADVKWQHWPADSIPSTAITRAASPDAIEKIAGSVVRLQVAQGEPVARQRVVGKGEAGFLATMLPAGMRAMAVPLDVRGGRSAGGFILPQDRVDVLVTKIEPSTSRAGGPPSASARALLEDIRVLAIGQQLSDANAQGQRTVVGETATLEVTPGQAEALAAAIKASSGEITLALRPFGEKPTSDASDQNKGSFMTVRFGVVR